jgi:predicted ATPase
MSAKTTGETNNWYVITGGPSTGKTTLLEVLAAKGYSVVPEAARLIIDEDLAQGLTIEEIRADEKAFQERTLTRKADIESHIGSQALHFFDRGMHDTIAYLRYYELPIEPWVAELVDQATYRRIFVLEPLPTYTTDYARTEDAGFTQAITGLFCEAYQAGGLDVLRVPATSIEDRVNFVLDRVQ